MTVPDDLAAAAAAYQRELGHPVPASVLQMYMPRPGPLILEIRQAVALRRPVEAWLARSRQPLTSDASWDWRPDGEPKRSSPPLTARHVPPPSPEPADLPADAPCPTPHG